MLDAIKAQYPLVLSPAIPVLTQLSDGIKCLCARAPGAQTETFHFISTRTATDSSGTVTKEGVFVEGRTPLPRRPLCRAVLSLGV